MKTVNGWLVPLNLGRYEDDYKMRAFISFVGLGALCREDAVYPTSFVDRDGKPLNGACEYVFHLDKKELFPSYSGIWSISAYRENFYVHNPIERYGITSGMPLVYNADGSLDVYIQARSPGWREGVELVAVSTERTFQPHYSRLPTEGRPTHHPDVS